MPDTAHVSIVNSALALLGNEPVAALDDAALAQSTAAVKILRQIEEARDVVLARHGWVCALEYVTLSPSVLAGNFRYPTVYQLPGDGLRVWEIGGVVFNGNEIDCWGPRWQTATIDTDLGPLLIIRAQNPDATLNVAYVRRASWGAMAPHLRDAVAFEAAARSCYSISGDQGLADKLAQRAEARVALAISVDGTQEGNQPPLAPSIPAQLRAYARR